MTRAGCPTVSPATCARRCRIRPSSASPERPSRRPTPTRGECSGISFDAPCRSHASGTSLRSCPSRSARFHPTTSIVIVRDMWQTGFDAPCLHTMYSDKPLQGRNVCSECVGARRFPRSFPWSSRIEVNENGILPNEPIFPECRGGKERAAMARRLAIQGG